MDDDRREQLHSLSIDRHAYAPAGGHNWLAQTLIVAVSIAIGAAIAWVAYPAFNPSPSQITPPVVSEQTDPGPTRLRSSARIPPRRLIDRLRAPPVWSLPAMWLRAGRPRCRRRSPGASARF